MNIRLLRRIQKVILEEPKRIRMGTWVTKHHEIPLEQLPACNTIACIAGWAVSLKEKRLAEQLERIWLDVEDRACEALELKTQSADKLFYSTRWPEKFQARLGRCKEGSRPYAKVVSDRIEHFITTKGMD